MTVYVPAIGKSPFLGRKSLTYSIKSDSGKGTCKQGERADLTGCTPASGEASSSQNIIIEDDSKKENKPTDLGFSEGYSDDEQIEQYREAALSKVKGTGMKASVARMNVWKIFDNKDAVKLIPPGSKFLGAGLEAIAYKTAKGEVVRLEMDRGPRPDLPDVLQATSSVVVGKGDDAIRVERLPLAKKVPPDQAKQEIEKIQERLKQAGFLWKDTKPANVGLVNGRVMIIDPGNMERVVPSTPFADRKSLVWQVKTDGPHKYGCIMLLPPLEVQNEILNWSLENIPDFHLGIGGRETDIHVTLKYGFLDSSPGTVARLKAMLSGIGPVPVHLKGLSLFKGNEDGDVLKIDVESDLLHELNKQITESFPCYDKYSDYRPHITIAYLQSEASGLYLEESPDFVNMNTVLTEAKWGWPDGRREQWTLEQVLPSIAIKDMSWLDSSRGGALVPPPEYRGPKPRKVKSSPFRNRKSLFVSGTTGTKSGKWEGKPCARGVSASRTGCIPAKKPSGGEPQKRGRKPTHTPEQSAKISQEVYSKIDAVLSGKEKLSTESITRVKDSLLSLTTKDIQEIKKKLGVKASGAKEALAQKIAERALGRKPVESAKEPEKSAEPIAEKPKSGLGKVTFNGEDFDKKVAKKVLGIDPTPETMASMIGLQGDVTLTVTNFGSDLIMHAQGDGYRVDRIFYRGGKGDLICRNEEIHVDDKGKGIGMKIFSSQVEQLAKMGVSRITCMAAGNEGHDKYIGYKVWPKFGYDGYLEEDHQSSLRQADTKEHKYSGANTIQELYAMPGGKEAWEKYGSDIKLSFYLSPDSQSRKIFNAYLEAKKNAGRT